MITINNYIHIQIKQIFIDKYIKQICNKNVQNMAEQKPFIKIYHRYVHNKNAKEKRDKKNDIIYPIS